MRTVWLTLALMACGGSSTPTEVADPGNADKVEEADKAAAIGKEKVEKTPEKEAPTAGGPTKPNDKPHPVEMPPERKERLLNPEAANKTAPDTFKVKFTTTKGDFVMQVHRDWAPLGADRLYNLVDAGFYDGVTFFRAVDGFMVQFGIHGDPQVSKVWKEARIKDDPVLKSNTRGMVSFATAGKDTRTTQMFINYVDRNKFLDNMGFSPVAEITEGMDVVDSLYRGYGEGAPRGKGPHQGKMQSEGNVYLNAEFPGLDHIVKAEIVE